MICVSAGAFERKIPFALVKSRSGTSNYNILGIGRTTSGPPNNNNDFRFMKTGEYGGIGAVITKIDDYVCISEPYEGFPAQKSGLMAGDKILKIDGISAKGKSTEDVSKILKGEKKITKKRIY